MHAGFHATDGWYFERTEDGGVRISAAVQRSTETLTVDAETWASIVAAVSASGGVSETYYAVRGLHLGAAAHTYTPECAGHHGLTEPCPGT